MSALPSPAAAAALVAAGFRRYASYRQATLAGAFTNTVFGVIKISILFAAASAAGGTVAGYDRAALSTYTWVSQGLIAVVWVFAWTPVVDRVRSGDVAIDLGRPVHPVAVGPLDDVPGTRLLSVDAGGLRQHLALTGSAAAAVAAVSGRAELRDLTIAEPDIEDVVARLYRRAAAARSSTEDG